MIDTLIIIILHKLTKFDYKYLGLSTLYVYKTTKKSFLFAKNTIIAKIIFI